jgi:competence protein ComEC
MGAAASSVYARHSGAPPLREGWSAHLARALDAERGRWFLWLPVFFGCGIALYLSLPVEPPVAFACAAVIIAAVLRMFFRLTASALILSSALFMAALGLLTAKLHAMLVDAPVLERTLRFATLDGWVERLERQENRTRLTLRVIRIERLTGEAMPRRVRISVRGDPGTQPLPGDAVRLRATLMPPPEPAIPGGFDFARFYWFRGIGASGYAMGKIAPLEAAPPAPWDLTLRASLGKLRDAIASRVGRVLHGDQAAIAKALIVGEKGELSETARQELRDAGLAHVIAISGFHMALTAGAMFWLIRAVLALFPSIALRFPIRIWAAIGALAIASLYLAISGAAVSAVRAYIMVSIIFIAVILSRPAISLRNLAIAALLILAVMPQSVVDVSFQMSFAATAALIAFYEARPSRRLFERWPAVAALPLLFVSDIAMTTLLASLAVDPLAAYHFHRVAVYSVIGNILAMPVVGFLVMPMVLLSLVAMPVGLEPIPLMAMEKGIDAMLAIAKFTASLPGASLTTASFAPGALTLMIAGGLWLIIWRGTWRWFGLVAIGAGLALAPFGERPDIWIDRDGKLIAVRDKDGAIATPNSRKASFSLERWMESDGDARPVKAARGSKLFQCDAASCIAVVKGKLVSHIQHPSALLDDCRRAAVLIATFPLPERCAQPEIVIDSFDLKEHGAHTLSVAPGGITVRTVGSDRGDRPWVISHWRGEKIPAIGADAEGNGPGADDSSGTSAGDDQSQSAQ